jgi:cytochrome c peroxidase
MLRAASIALLLLLPPWHPAAADVPDLMPVWRQLFARPAAPTPAGRDADLAPLRIALGRELFRDTRLSGPGDRACATCHDPSRAFTDGRPRGASRSGGDLRRNTPALFDVGWNTTFYWDGRAPTLEAQAAIPIEHPDEMAGDWAEIVRRLKSDPAIDVRFHQAFKERPAIQPATILGALAAYERTITSAETRFDRWIAGDESALSAVEMAGFRLFTGRAGCVGCHSGWRFTDGRFHDIGVSSEDPGRGAVPGGIPGLAAFKTPTLREVRWTAPYMHDGSKPTLADVVEHYASGFTSRPGLSANMVRGLVLSADERTALIAFVETLSSPAMPSGTAQGPQR